MGWSNKMGRIGGKKTPARDWLALAGGV